MIGGRGRKFKNLVQWGETLPEPSVVSSLTSGCVQHFNRTEMQYLSGDDPSSTQGVF